ncbi:hypothetical protein ACTQ1O_00940 [Bilifractor sp. LCP21S3_A7]
MLLSNWFLFLFLPLQSEELMKAIAESSQSYEDILRYIKGDPSKDEE